MLDVTAGGGGIDGGHTAFVLEGDGGGGHEVWTCGYGRWGALGTKAYSHIAPPRRVGALATLREWDESKGATLTIPVVAISSGDRHVAALLASGNVFVWGWCAAPYAHARTHTGGRVGRAGWFGRSPSLVDGPALVCADAPLTSGVVPAGTTLGSSAQAAALGRTRPASSSRRQSFGSPS